ncbi:TPA: hypothetical protein HA244_04720 [Candidatus Micrarchaeota archaeon]|nr:hypothetical protein [Candidatus Micrarchaeota archaeon]
MRLTKAFVVGRHTQRLKRVFARHFKIDMRKPDFVVSYGGDGTILYAERTYPGFPKIAFRNSSRCKRCLLGATPKIHKATEKVYCEACLENAIGKLKRGKFKILEFQKVEATAFFTKNGRRNSKTLIGLNDVQIHNSNHFHAVRFDFCLDGVCLEKEIIGDGVVVASLYGATAYFHAISRKTFSKGFGIAFNNPLTPIRPIFPKDGFKAEAHIQRRNAELVADNNPEMIALRKGDKVVFRPSKEKARIIQLQ